MTNLNTILYTKRVPLISFLVDFLINVKVLFVDKMHDKYIRMLIL